MVSETMKSKGFLVVAFTIVLHFSISLADLSPDESSHLSVSVTRVSVTDKDICLRDSECGLDEICKYASNDRYGRCTPVIPVGHECGTTGGCGSNAICTNPPNQRCRALGNLNESCFPDRDGTCRPGLYCYAPEKNPCGLSACSWPVGRCGKPPSVGTQCRTDRDCNRDAGHFCRFPTKRCTAPLPDGAFNDGTFQCRGDCISGPMHKYPKCVCAKTVPPGGRCKSSSECRGGLLCNQPRGEQVPGICVTSSKLRHRLGASCKRQHDLCDADRGLSCRWAGHLKRTVCQQKYETGKRGLLHCTSGSKLSLCPRQKNGSQMQCRTGRVVPGDPFAAYYENELVFTLCRPPRMFMPPGSDCSSEPVVCTGGSVCREIPGVRRKAQFRSPAQAAVYCVKELPLDAKCSLNNKFRLACAQGLQCKAGSCVPRKSQVFEEENTHAYVDVTCTQLPCAPGLSCTDKNVCENVRK